MIPGVTDQNAAELWASFPHDPRNPALAQLRASDADRQLVVQVVTEAFADGRLDREEYDERAAAVLAARTLGELPPLVADLVPDRPLVVPGGRAELATASTHDLEGRAAEKWRADRREALGAFLTVTLICWVIWVVVMPGGFPWPLFPMLGTGINLVRVVAGRRDILAAEVRRLEKKRAKELRARDEGPPAT